MMSNQPRPEYGASEYPKRTPSQPNGKDATEIYEPDKTGGTECEKLTNGKKCTESYDIEPIDVPLMSTEKSHAASIVHQRDRVLYKLDDVPPWYLTVLFGFQHLMVTICSDLAQSIIVAGAVCTAGHEEITAQIFSTVLFVAGLATVAQSTIGCRLPIVQGVTTTFVVPIVNFLSQPEWQCPDVNMHALTNISDAMTDNPLGNLTDPSTSLWLPRMREIQGAVILGGLFEHCIGMTGILGATKRWLGPLTISSVIIAIALAMVNLVLKKCSALWWICLLTAVLTIIFSQGLGHIQVPLPFVTIKNRKLVIVKEVVSFFKLFAIGLSLLLTWGLCGILTVADVLPTEPGEWGYAARTDTAGGIDSDSVPWIHIPKPFPWGAPRFNIALTLSIVTMTIVSAVDSVGDYYACASVAGAPDPPSHAVNRGIAIEGLACVVGALWGCANGTSSHGTNIAAMDISKVASRRVVQICGFILLLLSILPKFSSACVMIPQPVVGGLLLLTFSTLLGVGVSCLEKVNLKCSRTIVTLGFSLVLGMSVSQYIAKNPHAINTGNDTLDQILSMTLGNIMLVAGSIAFTMDNLLPGTNSDRGMEPDDSTDTVKDDTSTYHIPGLARLWRVLPALKYLPICPTGGATDRSHDDIPECTKI